MEITFFFKHSIVAILAISSYYVDYGEEKNSYNLIAPSLWF